MFASEFEHTPEAYDVDHVDLEGEFAGALDTLGAVFLGQTQQGVNPSHAGPGKWYVEDGFGKASGRRPVAASLADEKGRVAVGVSALLDREVGGISGPPAGRLPGMGLDQHAPIVETDDLAVGAGL